MSTQPTDRRGYEAFGSFHTPSTAALFADDALRDLPDPATFLPALTRSDRLRLAPSSSSSTAAVATAGVVQHNRALFTMDLERWTYLNHGAFGGPTRYATRVSSAWRAFADAQPLLFNDRLLFPYVVHSIKMLAEMLRVSRPQELALLPNATSGLHAVLASVLGTRLEDGDNDEVVMCFSTRYGAVRKMLQTLESREDGKRLRVHEEPLSLADSYDDSVVLERLHAALDAIASQHDARCALVVVDHITSNTGVVLPVEEIVRACHARRIPVLVDGAHGLLNLALDLDAINADYYVGNCHKWFASPKGAAFLHVNNHSALERTQRIEIQPRVVSHGFFDGYQSAFMWSGLQDYSPWLSLPSCIAFWEMQGVDACRSYIHSLVQSATELLYAAWRMDDELARAKIFPNHKRHAMRLIKLPSKRIFGVPVNVAREPNTSADAKHIQDALHHRFRVELPVKCVDEQLYVRISAHVYNSLADYERLAEVIATGE